MTFIATPYLDYFSSRMLLVPILKMSAIASRPITSVSVINRQNVIRTLMNIYIFIIPLIDYNFSKISVA